MTPYQKAGFNELSLFRVTKQVQTFHEGEIVWLLGDDSSLSPEFSSKGQAWYCLIDKDLKELPKDAEGFYLWDGGECPVPEDWDVSLKFAKGYKGSGSADGWDWSSLASNPIIAFKPLSRPDMPAVSGCTVTNEKPIGVVVGGTMAPQCQFSHEAGEVSALDVQEGGNHYKKLKIQPMEYSMANKLDACQHTIIKYVTRFRDKGGIEDLRKAKHCIDMLIEFEQQAKESKQ